VHLASTANCSNWASTSGNAVSANIWCAAANRRLRLGAPSWRTMPSRLVSIDFFTVPTIRFQVLYVFLADPDGRSRPCRVAAHSKRFRRLPIILHPADIALVIGGILPHADEHQSVAHVAVGDGSRVVGHATGTSSTDRVNDGVGKRRGNARVALNDGPDGSIRK